MTAMYSMKSNRISPYRRYCLEKTSPFCRMLIKVAHGLGEDEVSQLKLALLVDNHVTVQRMAELKNGAEVMVYLYSRHLISKKGASFLIELLRQINRVDLATLVENFFKDLNVVFEAVAISPRQRPLSESSVREPYSLQSTIGQTSQQSVYSFSSTFPSSLSRMASEDDHRHVHSVTDEETFLKQIPDLHLSYYEDTDPEKVSLKKSKSYGHVFPQLKEADMPETPSSQSSQMNISVDDLLSQESMMSISDDEKLSQIDKSTLLKTDDHLEAFIA